MRTVAFIFARGGSKGLPGKNIRPLLGKPMIAWAIEQTKAVKRISRVMVSTDSEEIAAIARKYGAETPFMRPSQLARDDSPEWLAWRHALNYLKSEGCLPDAMVSVPVTAPLREPIDIEKCIDDFSRGGADAVITVSPAQRSPYFNMVKRNDDGTVGLVITPPKNFSRRQDAPQIFDVATVAYVVSPEFVLTKNALFEGRIRGVEVSPENAIDIDTLLDFHVAECLLQRRICNKTKRR